MLHNIKAQFGGKATKDLISKYEKSPNWKKGIFENLEETSMSISLLDMPKLIYKQFTNTKEREPIRPIPVRKFNSEEFLENDQYSKFIWYGHSALLMRMNEKNILIDPMLGSNASPIAPFKTKRFSKNTLDLIDGFPILDLVIISHDHYDHLDYDSITKLKSKCKMFFVALGVKRHLVEWGIDSDIIQEFDWWERTNFSGIDITFTPSRHFSGRGISDRSKSLWGGWVFNNNIENIWFSGDGGYGKHFKEIGEQLGPFDFAFMECGQYNEKWHQIHMYPEESIQAAIEANAKKIMAVHWAGFSLAQHSWIEPIEEFTKHAKLKNIDYIHPNLGELIVPKLYENKESWWTNF